jgi:hypothetical protein
MRAAPAADGHPRGDVPEEGGEEPWVIVQLSIVKRRLFTILSALSLLLCVAVVVGAVLPDHRSRRGA